MNRDRIPAPVHAVHRRLHAFATRLAFRRKARNERVVSTSYDGFEIYYPELSIIGQAIASGTSWQGSLRGVVQALFADKPGPTVVEVGSNIGASLIEIKRADSAAVVYCFEPSRRFADLLERNIAANHLSGVTVERLMVGRESGTVDLHVNSSTASSVTSDYGGHHLLGTEAATMTTLDQYFGDKTTVDLLKIDTDGFDFTVVQGGRGLITRDAPVIYCEFAPFLLEETGQTGEEFLTFLRELGYGTIFPVIDGGQVLAPAQRDQELMAQTERERYVDLVAVHDRRPEQSRILQRMVEEAR